MRYETENVNHDLLDLDWRSNSRMILHARFLSIIVEPYNAIQGSSTAAPLYFEKAVPCYVIANALHLI